MNTGLNVKVRDYHNQQLQRTYMCNKNSVSNHLVPEHVVTATYLSIKNTTEI